MPSLNRPNAPDRLPSSDFGNLFGRPHAIRGSDLGSSSSSSSHPSPLTTPSNIAAQRRALRFSEGSNAILAANSPLASPSLLVSARPRPKGVERRSYHSDASAASPPESSSVASPSSEIPFILEDESAPLTGRTDSGISSSVTLQARLLHDLSGTQITPSAGSEQPPRTPRSGFKWKREFSGRWFEIRIGRQAQSAEHSVQESGEITPLPPSHSSTIRLPLSNASTSSDLGAHDQSPNAQSDQPLLPESRDSSDYAHLTLKEGLYCRTKRALGLKHDPLDPTNPTKLASRERTETDNLLERVSSTLRFLPNRKTPSQSSATSVSNLSIAAPRWQRMMSRHGRLGSTSSSIRGMMMGRPPLHTPEPEAMYTGSDSNTYVAVNLTEEGVAFLPSEARRVHTPPLPTGSTSAGKLRGFFFDYNAPLTPTSVFPERTTAAAAAITVVDATNAHARVGAGPRSDSDWYRVKTDAVEAEGDSREQLAAAVPEHLPNSPLCPRHPKHKSGGVGECPYHGRNPSLPKDVDDGASLKRSPPCEIWW